MITHRTIMSCLATISDDYIVKSTLSPPEYPRISFGEYARACIEAQIGSDLALIEPNNNGTLTFGELHSQAQQFARGLIQLGIQKSDLVLFFADNSLDLVVALFGCIYLGVTITPVTPANGPYELALQTEDCDARVMLFGANKAQVVARALKVIEYAPILARIKLMIALETDELDSRVLQRIGPHTRAHTFTQILQSSGANKCLERIPHFPVKNPADEALIIAYTSGTTGRPKGVILSHRSFVAMHMNASPREDVTGRVALIWNPIGHVSGVEFIPGALLNGQCVVLFSNSNLNEMLDAVQRYRAQELYISANHAASLALYDYAAHYDLSSLEIIRYGGTKIAAHLLIEIQQKYRVKMLEYYGSTEFYGHVQNRESGPFEPGNLGTVLPGVEMKIVNVKTGQGLPPNAVGEVCFRGTPCFTGYLNNAKATEEALDSDGWYRTGDVGYYTERGCLHLTDRLKELIKYKIWSIFPAEIEGFLQRRPEVAAVCVVGVPHVTDGSLIRAYVQLANGCKVSRHELIRYVEENMGFQRRLRAGVHFVAQMPRTVIGKIDRQYFKRLTMDELITEQVE